MDGDLLLRLTHCLTGHETARDAFLRQGVAFQDQPAIGAGIASLLRAWGHEVVGEVRQAISVIKKRTGRHERSIRELRFRDGEGIVIGEPVRDFPGVLNGSPMFVGGGPGGPRSGDGPPR